MNTKDLPKGITGRGRFTLQQNGARTVDVLALLIIEQRRTNELLERIAQRLEAPPA